MTPVDTQDSQVSGGRQADSPPGTRVITKVCAGCHADLPLDSFYVDKHGAHGRHRTCKDCDRQRQRDRREAKKAGVQGLIRRRAAAAPGNWAKGDPVAYDRFCAHIYHIRTTTPGATIKQISAALKIPERTVKRAFAHAEKQFMTGEWREHIRDMLLTALEEIAEEAHGSKQYDNARKAYMDIARLTGLVSTGGNVLNVGIQNNQVDLGSRVDEWMKRQKELAEATVDGELVAGGEEGTDDRTLETPDE